jgi:hypothetical protein
MESKLELIIAAIEREEKELKEAIKDFLEEEDFEFAFLQSKGLAERSSQLYQLNRIASPLFEPKHFLQNRIQNLQKILSKESSKPYRDYLLNELQAAEIELEILELRQTEEFFEPKQTTLDECLSQLLAKKIKTVSVIFANKMNLTICLTCKRRTLFIRISGLKQAVTAGWLTNYHIEKIEKLGFVKLVKSSVFSLKLKGLIEDLNRDAKQILARLTYDALPNNSIDKQGFIKTTQ